ncbi:C-GCAxxG-C-C family protein [Spirochaeta cellobiosiphila]|uniref:C-GCAxxG-C-C family protein n=1 Tax=Spirochaeta cellobiosiphila TaxID=504483 RepID=UPI0003F7F7B9|nr:C-GCAxxG-C-C family protein [Spirochaeta cellobiosiphila]
MDRCKKALEHFDTSTNCAQSVAIAFEDLIPLSSRDILHMASSFGAGMGGLQSVCGALTGAFMVTGFVSPLPETPEDKVQQKLIIHDLASRFEKRTGTMLCKELVQCDLNTEEGQAYFKEKGIKQKVCHSCVRTAIETFEQMHSEGIFAYK